jgi:hypothetical protein
MALWNLGENAAPPRYFVVERAEEAPAAAAAVESVERPKGELRFSYYLLPFLRAVAPFPGAVEAVKRVYLEMSGTELSPCGP